MLSLASLLNPAPPGPPINRFPPSPALSSPTTSFADDSSFPDRHIIPKHKMPKDAAVFTKSKPKGEVNFPPFERLDPASLCQVRRFQIYPFGKIQEYSRHIPYNSGKKDFYEKTGRESFEAFQYVFRVPGDDTEYTVMWDYNVGLVRMTPFFKCCKYPKTTPAKMLNSNPGLKEITHSITGGSIMAQGYWMPYQCAKAVCATFCHNIAGALIPIFGPNFPSLCTPSENPEYSRMIIDPAIVVESTKEAKYLRRQYHNHSSIGRNNSMAIASTSSPARSSSPKRDRRLDRNSYDDNRHQLHPRMRKNFITTPTTTTSGIGGFCDSPYATDTDGDVSPSTTDRSSMGRELHRRPIYPPMPPPTSSSSSSAGLRPSTSSWTPANVLPQPRPHPHPPHHHSRPLSHYETPGPSPWLSAVPRFTTTAHLPPPPPPAPAYPSPHSRSNPNPPHPHPHPSSRSQPPPQHHHHDYHQHQPSQPWRPNSSGSGGGGGGGGSKRPASHISHEHEHDGGPPPPPPRRFSNRQPYATHDHDHGHAGQEGAGEKKKNNSNGNGGGSGGDGLGDGRGAKHGRPARAGENRPAAGDAGADKKAALLLMNLSVRDSRGAVVGSGSGSGKDQDQDQDQGRVGNSGTAKEDGGGGGGSGKECTAAVPRIKRVRSNSM